MWIDVASTLSHQALTPDGLLCSDVTIAAVAMPAQWYHIHDLPFGVADTGPDGMVEVESCVVSKARRLRSGIVTTPSTKTIARR
jgi:hypothetical protein